MRTSSEARFQQLSAQLPQLQSSRASAVNEVSRVQRALEELWCAESLSNRQKQAQNAQATQMQEVTNRCRVVFHRSLEE